MSEQSEFATASEAARHCNVPQSRIVRAICKGTLRAAKLGGFPNSVWMLRLADAEKLFGQRAAAVVQTYDYLPDADAPDYSADAQ